MKELASLLADDDSESVAASFASRAPASYRDQTSPAEAARDIGELAALRRQIEQGQTGRSEAPGAFGLVFGGPHRLVVRPSADEAYLFRIRRYGEGSIELTRFLPVLESFGLVVVESVPLHIGPGPDGRTGGPHRRRRRADRVPARPRGSALRS